MFSLAIPAWDIVLRTVAVYVFIIIGMRLTGKREMGQMTIFDLEPIRKIFWTMEVEHKLASENANKS